MLYHALLSLALASSGSSSRFLSSVEEIEAFQLEGATIFLDSLRLEGEAGGLGLPEVLPFEYPVVLSYNPDFKIAGHTDYSIAYTIFEGTPFHRPVDDPKMALSTNAARDEMLLAHVTKRGIYTIQRFSPCPRGEGMWITRTPEAFVVIQLTKAPPCSLEHAETLLQNLGDASSSPRLGDMQRLHRQLMALVNEHTREECCSNTRLLSATKSVRDDIRHTVRYLGRTIDRQQAALDAIHAGGLPSSDTCVERSTDAADRVWSTLAEAQRIVDEMRTVFADVSTEASAALDFFATVLDIPAGDGEDTSEVSELPGADGIRTQQAEAHHGKPRKRSGRSSRARRSRGEKDQ